MPFTAARSMNIFLSYASEDQVIADALAGTLREAFFDRLEITMMSEFQSGLNWRTIIDSSIEKADILIAIATGQLKRQHSFTGYEVGSFAQSRRSKPNMEAFPDLDRRMIPFAVLDRAPDTMADFEGVNLNPDDLRDIRFDAANVDDEIKKLMQNPQDGAAKGAIKLIGDIQDIISKAFPGNDGRNYDNILAKNSRYKYLEELSCELCITMFKSMANKKKTTTFPKSKVVFRVEPNAVVNGDFVTGASITVQGPCADAFGFGSSNRNLDWQSFTRAADGQDIVYAWKKSFNSLLSDESADNFIDSNTILSFDRKKIFRIFVSKMTTFYSGAREYEVNVIKLLRSKDFGDPSTTILLKALQVSLGYRFMFLESLSEYSPNLMRAVNVSKFRDKISDMKNSLDLLLQLADESELNEAGNIITILGEENAVGLEELFALWEKEKSRLDEAAQKIMICPVDVKAKLEFIEQLEHFCDHTRAMNQNYTTRVMAVLENRISGQSEVNGARPNSRTAPTAAVAQRVGNTPLNGGRLIEDKRQRRRIADAS